MIQMNDVNAWAKRLKRIAILSIMLVVAWLLWSGMFKPLLLGFGVFSCALTVYLTYRMGYFDNQKFALRFGMRLLKYWAWLGREIWRSSIDVALIVMAPRLRISPQTVTIKASADHPVAQAILGNSITLTPGTLALDVHQGEIQVHCLTKAGAEALLEGSMDRRVAELGEG